MYEAVYGCSSLISKKAFDITWHSGLLYKLFKFEFLSQRKFRVSVEGVMSASRVTQAGVPQGSILSRTLYKYINDAHEATGVYVTLFADDTCLYATEHKEGYVRRKLQRGLSSIEAWCEC
jgi:hypothetical protein